MICHLFSVHASTFGNDNCACFRNRCDMFDIDLASEVEALKLSLLENPVRHERPQSRREEADSREKRSTPNAGLASQAINSSSSATNGEAATAASTGMKTAYVEVPLPKPQTVQAAQAPQSTPTPTSQTVQARTSTSKTPRPLSTNGEEIDSATHSTPGQFGNYQYVSANFVAYDSNYAVKQPISELSTDSEDEQAAGQTEEDSWIVSEDFEDLKNVLKRTEQPTIISKIHIGDRRRSREPLSAFTRMKPDFLANSANSQYTNDEEFLLIVEGTPDLPLIPATKRHDQYDDPPIIGQEDGRQPVLYRIIDTRSQDGFILCELVFPHQILRSEVLHFVVITQDSIEAPHMTHRGYNAQFVAINDLVWIYDVKPFDKTKLSKRLTFKRKMFRAEEVVHWSAKIHCFLETTEFHSAYGYMMDKRGSCVLTGSNEVIDIYKTDLPGYLQKVPEVDDAFRIDYIGVKSFNALQPFIADIAHPFRVGCRMSIIPGNRSKDIYVIAVNILDEKERKKMKDPFKHCHSLIEAVTYQTMNLGIAKFTDAVLQQRDAEASTTAANIEWISDRTGIIVLRRYSDYKEFVGCKFMSIRAENVLTFLVQLEMRGRRRVDRKSNKCFLEFSVHDDDKSAVRLNYQNLRQITEIYVSPVEQNPCDDHLLGYMTSGLMARTLASHLLDPRPVNAHILTGLRKNYFKKQYDLGNGKIKINSFAFGNRFVKLDEHQQQVTCFLSRKQADNNLPSLAVIQACAGAGKTLCSFATIMEMIRDNNDSCQLMCATTNRAVDNLAECLCGFEDARPVRIYSKTARDQLDDDPDFSLDAVMNAMLNKPQTYQLDEDEEEIVSGYLRLKRMGGKTGRSQGQYFGFQNMKQRAENAAMEIIKRKYRPNIILTTIDLALREQLQTSRYNLLQTHFERILVDEGSQLDEARFLALLSLNMTSRQIVVVGDRKQLPPYSSFDLRDNLREIACRSCMDVLVDTKNVPVLDLKIGYRMNHGLLKLTSEVFYDNQVIPAPNGGPPRRLTYKWGRFSKENPIIVGYTGGEEGEDGTSKINDSQAKVTVALIEEALKAGVNFKSIGVICLYNGQVRLLNKLLQKHEVEVASVDSFQGREKDYIIVNTVRSSDVCGYKNAFFSDMRRANVATSRAVLGVAILGEEASMINSEPWEKIVEFAKRENILDGNFGKDILEMIERNKPKPISCGFPSNRRLNVNKGQLT
ncbi:hypothetical protein L596_002088 [Steinernema carpocapsae]|uniref:DNA2/NAM7 helicase-like C-terminal domain-containing protein n=1 Tax=Steinernema carpocapsae TaxID=34508 RepID=A0A4U8UN22_STECR|nr:hypothetical protein L596_002088 [Steinernema carpocapsae]